MPIFRTDSRLGSELPHHRPTVSATRRWRGELTDLPPDDIQLGTATGGFDAVIQISEEHCRSLLHKQLRLVVGETRQLSSGQAEALPTVLGIKLQANKTIEMDISISVRWQPNERPVAEPTESLQGVTSLEMEEPSPHEPNEPGSSTYGLGSYSSSGGSAAERPEQELIGYLGGIASLSPIKLVCRYAEEQYVEMRQAEVLVTEVISIDDGQTTWYPVSLLSDVLDASAPDNSLRSLANDVVAQLVETVGLSVIPRLSLTGVSPQSKKADAVGSRYDCKLFVARRRGKAALTVGVNLDQSEGVPNMVPLFLAGQAYGVILNELAFEGALKYRWSLGHFHRELPFNEPVTLKLKDTSVQSVFGGTSTGVLRLDDLSDVMIRTDSTTRSDYIGLSGSAALTVEEAVLDDGRVLEGDELENQDWGELTWSIATVPSVTPQFSSNLEIQKFQQKAHLHGYRHICRPFANNVVDVRVEYTRVDGASKHVLVLGGFDNYFI